MKLSVLLAPLPAVGARHRPPLPPVLRMVTNSRIGLHSRAVCPILPRTPMALGSWAGRRVSARIVETS